MQPFALIPLYERCRLCGIHLQTLVYCLLVVVRTTRLLSALYQPFHQLVLRNVELYHRSHVVSAFGKHCLESLSLRYGARESVEDYTLMLLAEAVVNTCKNVYHQRVRYELSVVNVSLGCLAQLRAVLYLIAQHVTGRNMVESILLDHQVTLCALA